MVSNTRTGFTLIELLVVIAVIAILASILFPVVTKAKDKARQSTCMSNLKQVAMGMSMYTEDFEGRFCPAIKTDFLQWYTDSTSTIVTDPNLPGSHFKTSIGFGLAHYFTWMDYISSNVKDWHMFTCPSQSTPELAGYGYNAAISGYARGMYKGTDLDLQPACLEEIRRPSQVLVLLDFSIKESLYPLPGTNFDTHSPTVAPHSEGMNTSYADGHCKWVRLESLMGFLPSPLCPMPWNPFTAN